MPDEEYVRWAGLEGYRAWTYKLCLWCQRTVDEYCRGWGDGEWDEMGVLEWLEDEHPSTYAAFRAGWRYPDGERLPLPFQFRCSDCRKLLHGYRIWCSECDDARIRRISGQFQEIHQQLTRETS